MQELVKQLTCNDFNVINGVLTTMDSVFKKYRYQFSTEDLKREIVYVLGQVQEALHALFLVTFFVCGKETTVVLRVLFSQYLKPYRPR